MTRPQTPGFPSDLAASWLAGKGILLSMGKQIVQLGKEAPPVRLATKSTEEYTVDPWSRSDSWRRLLASRVKRGRFLDKRAASASLCACADVCAVRQGSRLSVPASLVPKSHFSLALDHEQASQMYEHSTSARTLLWTTKFYEHLWTFISFLWT